MKFDKYQDVAAKTAVYPKLGHGATYVTLGLVGEAGEVAEKVKKMLRDDNAIPSKEKIQEIKKELGDVLWYLSQVAREFDLKLSEIAEANIEKLSDRHERDVIKGSGDNR